MTEPHAKYQVLSPNVAVSFRLDRGFQKTKRSSRDSIWMDNGEMKNLSLFKFVHMTGQPEYFYLFSNLVEKMIFFFGLISKIRPTPLNLSRKCAKAFGENFDFYLKSFVVKTLLRLGKTSSEALTVKIPPSILILCVYINNLFTHKVGKISVLGRQLKTGKESNFFNVYKLRNGRL